MEVEITDKGRDYLNSMKESNLPESATDGYSIFDFEILSALTRVESINIDKDLNKIRVEYGSMHFNGFKISFRRLFEAGYIEEY